MKTATCKPTAEIALVRHRGDRRTMTVPVQWVGSHLVIHRPTIVNADGEVSGLSEKGWALSHLATGARVTSIGNFRKLRAFAIRWDGRMGFRSLEEFKHWPHRDALALALIDLR